MGSGFLKLIGVFLVAIFIFVGCEGGEDFEEVTQNNNTNQQSLNENGSGNGEVTVGKEFTKILKTGQKASYYEADDGTYQIGLDRNFEKDGSVVVDHTTGLIWQDDRDAVVAKKTWYLAVDYCEELNLAGYDNWRLPTVKELMSITDKSKYTSSIDSAFEAVNVENARYKYWTSQTNPNNLSEAYYVDFRYGSYGISNKEFSHFIRCVSSE